MGKDKFSMDSQLMGRNQLIGKYLVIAMLSGPRLTPLPAMMVEDTNKNKMRKKVSSHIQVIKNFFKAHRMYHMIFDEQALDDKKDDKKRTTVKASLKNNPVLLALAENRLPAEQPNYEYFAQILQLNDIVQFRPSRCWIFVSHPDVRVREDGLGYVRIGSGGSNSEEQLRSADWPHLARNLERGTWPKDEQQQVKGALLHEFTREFGQAKAVSVRHVAQDWEFDFPALHQRVMALTASTDDTRCEFFNFHVRLGCTESANFPSGSNFSAWVEVNFEHPRLLHHRWKVETRIVRPSELRFGHGGIGGAADDEVEDKKGTAGGTSSEFIHERHAEITVKHAHRPGCEVVLGGAGDACNCFAQQQQQQGRSRREGVSVPLHVPFPATVWAETLAACAGYAPHLPVEPREVEVQEGKDKVKRTVLVRVAGPRVKKEEEGIGAGAGAGADEERQTQMDLLPRIAMLQEISSCPPQSPHHHHHHHHHPAGGSDGAGQQRWSLRAVILWTFESLFRWRMLTDTKGTKHEVLEAAPNGHADWRFLTILDPQSKYHERNAIVSPPQSSSKAPSALVDDYKGGLGGTYGSRLAIPSSSSSVKTAVVPPSPTYSLSLSGGAMADGFSPMWDGSSVGGLGGLSGPASYGGAAHFLAGNMNDGGSFASSHSSVGAGGLDTPPPSASFTRSFSESFNAVPATGELLPGYLVTADGENDGIDSSLAAVTDPLLANMGNTYSGMHDGDLSAGWDGQTTFDPWATSEYPNSNGSHNGVMDWSNHQHQQQQQQQQQQIPIRRTTSNSHRQRILHRPHRQHPWVPSIITTTTTTGNTSIDDHDPWTPIHSAHTSGSDLNDYMHHPLSAGPATTTTSATPGPTTAATHQEPTQPSDDPTTGGPWVHVLPSSHQHQHHQHSHLDAHQHQHQPQDPTSAVSATSASSFSSVHTDLPSASSASATDMSHDWVDVQTGGNPGVNQLAQAKTGSSDQLFAIPPPSG
ncbi:hypothetical protein VTJ49DRAFT_6504 [Mycothermus thermophilus]|uniref:TEA domain-containing protein n=1 Tax=Humicola insolens TaxID=85995 RepID=A0ABR3V177_HUMIN